MVTQHCLFPQADFCLKRRREFSDCLLSPTDLTDTVLPTEGPLPTSGVLLKVLPGDCVRTHNTAQLLNHPTH